jgi:hypothetical protein
MQRSTRRPQGWRDSVCGPTLGMALAYLLFALAALYLHGGDPLWFAWLGERYMSGAPNGSIGYDGQFVYAIAQDGLEATPRLDNPPYRLQRILLPLAVGLLSGRRTQVILWLIPLVNWAAISGATYLLAHWLAERRLSPWYALVYAGYVGTLMAFSRNLTEPLMVLLAVAGVVAWHRERPGWAAFWLALAMLAKETALVFVGGVAIHALWQRRYSALPWLGVSLLPLLLWQGMLYRRFGVLALTAGPGFELIPLRGILGQLTWEPGRLSALLLVALPALALAVWALWRLKNEPGALGLWLVLGHAVPLLFLPAAVYDHLMHAGRNAAGLAAGLVFAMPWLSSRGRWFALAYGVAPSLVWLIPILRWTPWR